MPHLEVNGVSFNHPSGPLLLREISFKVAEGDRAALVGPNGAGKSSLLQIVLGTTQASDGSITRSGTFRAMPQFLDRDPTLTVRDALVSVADEKIRQAYARLQAAETTLASDELEDQMRYAHALGDWGDVGGYDLIPEWDKITQVVLRSAYDDVSDIPLQLLSGGEQKRLVLEALFRCDADFLVLDEPDNFLDVGAKEWLEDSLRHSRKAVLLVSHDRELLARAATKVISLEPSANGATAWVHGGPFTDFAAAREARNERLDELSKRWKEELAKLQTLVREMRARAKYNDTMAPKLHAAETRLARFEAAGPPEARPRERPISVKLAGSRTGRRVLEISQLGVDGVFTPFDFAVWLGDRIAVTGPNGSGKSHFLRALADAGSHALSDRPQNDQSARGIKVGARVRVGYFEQTHRREDLASKTVLEILAAGDDERARLGLQESFAGLGRYGLAEQANLTYAQLSGGQQARLQILLLEVLGANVLVLDEPTDNLDLSSADALQRALQSFEGTVISVTHDRWFAREFNRFLTFARDGCVLETDGPDWR